MEKRIMGRLLFRFSASPLILFGRKWKVKKTAQYLTSTLATDNIVPLLTDNGRPRQFHLENS